MSAAWIEKLKRPGARTVYRVKWRVQVDGKWKKIPSEVLHSREEAIAVKKTKDEELAQISHRTKSAGLIIPWPDLLQRWRASRLTLGRITETYGHEVITNLTRVATINNWSSVADITRHAVEQWRDQVASRHSLAKGTHKPFRQLKAVLRWAANDPHLRQPVDTEVLRLEQRPQARHEPPPLLTTDQVARVVRRAYSLGQRYGVLIEHLSRYGCRPIDCCRLRVKDWDTHQHLLTLRETKNGDDVTHPVDQGFAAQLDAITAGRAADEALYLSPKGEPWRINDIGMATELRDWYRNHLSSYELPRTQWGIYLLKDYAITTMERRGIDDRTKALFTGHRDLSCLQRYKTTNLDQARAALDQIAMGATAETNGGRIGGKADQLGANVVELDQPGKTAKKINIGKLNVK